MTLLFMTVMVHYECSYFHFRELATCNSITTAKLNLMLIV